VLRGQISQKTCRDRGPAPRAGRKERLEHQAQKETKITEQKRLEEEVWREQEKEETQQREEKCQRDLAHHLEADHIAAVEQQRRKN